jgi:predicted NodU family carbamoyl transferase
LGLGFQQLADAGEVTWQTVSAVSSKVAAAALLSDGRDAAAAREERTQKAGKEAATPRAALTTGMEKVRGALHFAWHITTALAVQFTT